MDTKKLSIVLSISGVIALLSSLIWYGNSFGPSNGKDFSTALGMFIAGGILIGICQLLIDRAKVIASLLRLFGITLLLLGCVLVLIVTGETAQCLYSFSSECEFVNRGSFSPVFFWIGLVALAVGIITNFSRAN